MAKVVRRRTCAKCNGTRKITRFVGCSRCMEGMVATKKAIFLGFFKAFVTLDFNWYGYIHSCEQKVCPVCKGEQESRRIPPASAVG